MLNCNYVLKGIDTIPDYEMIIKRQDYKNPKGPKILIFRKKYGM